MNFSQRPGDEAYLPADPDNEERDPARSRELEARKGQRQEPEVPQEVLKANSAEIKTHDSIEGSRTCEVQTLLNVTNANVCTNHANARSCAPNANPSPIERPSWGTNAASGWRRIVVHTEVAEEEVAR